GANLGLDADLGDLKLSGLRARADRVAGRVVDHTVEFASRPNEDKDLCSAGEGCADASGRVSVAMEKRLRLEVEVSARTRRNPPPRSRILQPPWLPDESDSSSLRP